MTGRLRWVGLAGTTLLAVGGYLAGATPGAAPATQSEALWGTGAGFRVGLAAYLLGLLLLGWAWWRIGDRLRRGAPAAGAKPWAAEMSAGAGEGPSNRPGLRWLLVTGALWAAPLLVAPPLGSRDLYAYACQGAVWLDGHDPYAVGAAGGGCPWLESVPGLWHETTAPYGPVALLASAAVVALARALAAGETGQLLVAVGGLRLVAVAGALLVAGFGPRLARACRIDPAQAAWLGLVTPLMAVHAVAGGHNDALVAGLVVAGLALAASIKEKRTPGELQSHAFFFDRLAGWAWVGAGAAGVALGLAVAVKVTAVAALPFALLLAAGDQSPPARLPPPKWPRRDRYRSPAALAVAAVAGFAGLSLLTGLGTGWTRALTDTGALGQWSSPPTGLGMAVGYALRGLGAPAAYDPAVSVAQALGLAVLVVVGAGLLLRAWRRRHDQPAVVAAAGATLAAVVLLGPVVYPWYALTPLAVLAAAIAHPRARYWLAVATLVLTALALPSGLGVPVLTKFPGALLMVLLVVVVSWRWWRQAGVMGEPDAPSPDAPPGRPDPADPPREPRAPAR